MDAEALSWSSDSSFRLWRYGVGHSQLSIRTFGGDTGDVIELLFEGVERVELNRQYRGLRVSVDHAGTGADRQLEVLLDSPSGAGSVTCSRVTIRRLRGDDCSEIEVLVSVPG
jgi:hypothetical protein